MRMISRIAPVLIAACALLSSTTSSFAHDGHGMEGAHWHATDAWGLVGMATLVAIALWLGRGKK